MSERSEQNDAGQHVIVMRLDHGQDLPLPAYQSKLASGVDLYAAIEPDQPMTLAPRARAMIPTGISLEIPEHMEAQVRPRSGLAAKSGLTVLNTPGTIDADYRGEIKVILINLGDVDFIVERGMRIAQLVFQPVIRVGFEEAKSLNRSERGAGGFGSSGV